MDTISQINIKGIYMEQLMYYALYFILLHTSSMSKKKYNLVSSAWSFPDRKKELRSFIIMLTSASALMYFIQRIKTYLLLSRLFVETF